MSDTTTARGPMEQKLIDVFAGLTIPQGVANGWYDLLPFARQQDALLAEAVAALDDWLKWECPPNADEPSDLDLRDYDEEGRERLLSLVRNSRAVLARIEAARSTTEAGR